MKFGSLFSGIGGMDLGLERAGMECRWQVEIDDYATKVLEKHWPDVRRFRDVRDVGKHNLEPVDLICGGFPCQDISAASSTGTGLDGKRSGLWAEYARLICELRPTWVLVENVERLLSINSGRDFGAVLRDLARNGYDAEWRVLRASQFGAPHRRARVFIIAYANEVYERTRVGSLKNGQSKIFAEALPECFEFWAQTISEFNRVADGVRDELYKSQIGGLGNAVVPQVAQWIGRRIMESAS
jgi:DNA (cytosine-5)-methyltransferase 1